MSSDNKPGAVKATRVPIVGNLERGVDEIDKVLASGNTDLEIDFAACTFVAVDGLEWLEELRLFPNEVQPREPPASPRTTTAANHTKKEKWQKQAE